LISMNFGVKSSIEEKVILAMKPAKPRCAGKTRAAEHSPPFRRIFEYSTSNVRLRFIKPESESLNIRQTRIQVPEVEYSICRSLHNTYRGTHHCHKLQAFIQRV